MCFSHAFCFCYDFVNGLCLFFFARSNLSQAFFLLLSTVPLVATTILRPILRPIFWVSLFGYVSSIPDFAPQTVIGCVHAVDYPFDYSFPSVFRCVEEILWIDFVFDDPFY